MFDPTEKVISHPTIKNMKPSAPKNITWIIGLICGILGIIGHFTTVQFLSEHNYTLLLIGFIALAVGTSFKGV
jgi:hypothetical protein